MFVICRLTKSLREALPRYPSPQSWPRSSRQRDSIKFSFTIPPPAFGRFQSEQVLENRAAGAFRVRSLRHLRELQRITEKNHIACTSPHRQCVRERDLTRLVDHERVDSAVEVFTREQPGRPEPASQA